MFLALSKHHLSVGRWTLSTRADSLMTLVQKVMKKRPTKRLRLTLQPKETRTLVKGLKAGSLQISVFFSVEIMMITFVLD